MSGWIAEPGTLTISAPNPKGRNRARFPIAYLPVNEVWNREANAPVIAAAPDLLAACQLALLRAKSDLHFLPSLDRLAGQHERQSLSAFIATLKAAIEKATAPAGEGR